jgi:molecular chaperone GrpE
VTQKKPVNPDPDVDVGAEAGVQDGLEGGLESPRGPQETAAPAADTAARTADTADTAGDAPGEAPPPDGAAPVAPDDEEGTAGPTAESDVPDTEQRLAERTADLQRLQAEFLNYKRRVERDRDLVRQNAVFTVLTPMLDVLDSIDRARESGEHDGGFKGVADQLERIVNGLGLTKFGKPGDPFDPTRHEALSHVGVDPEVDVITCKHIAKSGYLIGDRVVRAAQVLVVDPAPTE